MLTSFRGTSRAQGHWLKYKNNHIYYVTKCGGPMEKAKCLECNDIIGGKNHAYASGTSLSPEKDNAKYFALSEGNNILNYNM